MANPLISVIMPVYNVEKYLEQSVKSVLNQTYENFELILVDDKATDSSPEMCDKFVQLDKRVQVIHKPQNEGLGFARNTGLDAAKGQYILFIDSDDYIDAETLSKSTSNLTDTTEVLVYGINRFYENKNGDVKKHELLSPLKASTSSPTEVADLFVSLTKAKVFPFAWNKLYKTSFLREIGARFEKTKTIEDFLFNIYVFSKATNVNVIPDELYHYRKPQHETLASAYNPDFFNLCKRKYLLEKEFLATTGSTKEENQQIVYASYVKHLFSFFIKNKKSNANLSFKEQLNQMEAALKDELTIEVLNKYIPDEFILTIVSKILKTQNTTICYILTCIASFIF